MHILFIFRYDLGLKNKYQLSNFFFFENISKINLKIITDCKKYIDNPSMMFKLQRNSLNDSI